MIPSNEDLWFIPLGGTGEIGMNLNLYGHDGKWLMLDCGISFDEPLTPEYLSDTAGPRFRVVAPDPSFVARQKEALEALVVTHAHEDHLGAVAHLWPRLKCPVFAPPFAAEILRRKLQQAGILEQVPLHEVRPDTPLTLGNFRLTWLHTTHSIPEPFALVIETPVGKVLHTADWKIDASPITGKPFDPKVFKSLAEQNILALVGDSTNATKPGFSISERLCFDGLLSVIRKSPKRVVVGCFGSNIARLISLARIAQQTGRYLALFGRSLVNMYSVARLQGIWPDDLTVIDPHHVGFLPPEEVMVIGTGSQGDKYTALARLAEDSHPLLSLDQGDKVIFSSMVIPGNEVSVQRLCDLFHKRKIDTLLSEDSVLPIHASGHPNVEELKLMYHWVQPEIAVPTHGEDKHLSAHAEVAKEMGIRKQLVGRNGDIFCLAPVCGIKRGRIPVGRIPIDN